MERNPLDNASTPIHPGKVLRRMLEERGWTQDELAAVINRRRQPITDINSGKSGIAPEMAVALAAVFEISAEEWVKMDAAFRLSTLPARADPIQRMAQFY